MLDRVLKDKLLGLLQEVFSFECFHAGLHDANGIEPVQSIRLQINSHNNKYATLHMFPLTFYTYVVKSLPSDVFSALFCIIVTVLAVTRL